MKYLIPIKSRRPNPHYVGAGGRRFVPGPSREEIRPNGTRVVHREALDATSLADYQRVIVEYDDTQIQCSACGAAFSWRDLEADAYTDGDDTWSNSICPKCGEWDCAEIELEQP